ERDRALEKVDIFLEETERPLLTPAPLTPREPPPKATPRPIPKSPAPIPPARAPSFASKPKEMSSPPAAKPAIAAKTLAVKPPTTSRPTARPLANRIEPSKAPIAMETRMEPLRVTLPARPPTKASPIRTVPPVSAAKHRTAPSVRRVPSGRGHPSRPRRRHLPERAFHRGDDPCHRGRIPVFLGDPTAPPKPASSLARHRRCGPDRRPRV